MKILRELRRSQQQQQRSSVRTWFLIVSFCLIITTAANFPHDQRRLQTATWGSNEKTLEVSMGDGNGNYGITFTIKALELNVEVTTLDFNSDSESTVDVKVYTRPGLFNKTEMETADKWTLAADTSVTAYGAGQLTPIPQEMFTPVMIEKNQLQTFYVTLATKELRYSNVSEFSPGDVYISDKFLEFYAGKGVGEPFLLKMFGKPARIFNGAVYYVTEADLTTQNPTPSPVLPWVETYLVNQNLTTTLQGVAGGYGCMFEIRAVKNLVIRSLEMRINQESNVEIKIYTKSDTYAGFESNKKPWKEVANVKVVGKGPGILTQIPTNDFVDVAVPMGKLQSFYITLRSPDVILTQEDKLLQGDVFVEDVNMQLLVGDGFNSYDFHGDTSPRRVFNGVVNYSIEKSVSKAPVSASKYTTSNPAAAVMAPQKAGPVISQQLIEISGVSDTRLRQLVTHTPDGRLLLTDDAIDYFQKVSALFLQSSIGSDAINITHVIVSPDITAKDVTHRRSAAELNMTLDEKEIIPEDGSKENQTIAEAPEGTRSLGLYTTFAGDYHPPPILDFNELVGNSFNDKGSSSEFVGQLTKKEYFATATGVSSTPVKFPLPLELMERILPKGLTQLQLYLIYAACGLVVVLVVCCCSCMEYRKRQKANSQSKSKAKDQQYLPVTPYPEAYPEVHKVYPYSEDRDCVAVNGHGVGDVFYRRKSDC